MTIRKACDPYPSAPDLDISRQHPGDFRHAVYLSRVLDGLDAHEIRDLARCLGVLHPRDFEQGLFWIQRNRDMQRAGQAAD